ncbi:prenylated rab acceptor PRA1 [Schizophyllum commune Loenen D]|nr:prenylated rab acceptor PRA1 [Schizophyllum commune Loenen D]
MEVALKAMDALKNIRETRLSALRSPTEFFDYTRVSKPESFNVATQRITYNTRYFSGNYVIIIAMLSVYAVITNPLLLISVGFLVGGFMAINKWAPEPMQVGEHTITQKHLYTGLFVIGIPMLFVASPFATAFWIIGASGVLILGHAALLEPGIESEYASVEGAA